MTCNMGSQVQFSKYGHANKQNILPVQIESGVFSLLQLIVYCLTMLSLADAAVMIAAYTAANRTAIHTTVSFSHGMAFIQPVRSTTLCIRVQGKLRAGGAKLKRYVNQLS